MTQSQDLIHLYNTIYNKIYGFDYERNNKWYIK